MTVEDRALDQLNQNRAGIGMIIGALDDPSLSDREFRETVSTAELPLRSSPVIQGKVQAIRTQIGRRPALYACC